MGATGGRVAVLPWLWYGLALVVLVLDQLSKAVASASLEYASPVVVTSFFNWTLLHNTGAAFSFLSNAGGWQRGFFILISVAISLVIIVWMARLPASARRQLVAMALVLGGALGNLWDRILHGFVVDFIQLHYGGYYWPAFNIADSAICVGAAILIIDSLFPGREQLEP
ncbi:MAG TPA: signal peptidase II [Porticoccaceae bacterium]